MLVERKSLRNSGRRDPPFRSLALQRLACLDLGADAFRDIGDRLLRMAVGVGSSYTALGRADIRGVVDPTSVGRRERSGMAR